MATTAATGTTDAQKEIGTGHTGIRPLDYSAGGRATLESFLKSVPLLSLSRPHSTVVCLHDRDTLPHALATLGDHSFLSAPVLNDLGASVGMVSVNDLAAALVTVADAALQDAGQDIRLQRLQELWGGHLVGQVMNISDRSPLVPLPHDASLWDGLERLAKGGAHSVVVMRADGSAPEALYSQGAVLGYLFHHLHHFSSIARMMVQQVANFSQVGSPHPLHVAEDVPLLEAFRVIREQAVTGVVVVSRGRKVVGVISATDVRMLGPNMERGELLFASAGNFVRQVQQQNPLLLSKVVSCTPVDTVGMVMEKMMDNAVHRVFVVRTHHGLEEDVPLDVLAMRDILLLFQPDA